MIETLTNIQWLVSSLAALSIGMSKTGVQGIMLMIVPLMAMAFGAKESTGIILPMLCMADIIAVAYYKRIADWKIVAKLLPTAVLGFFLAIGVDNVIPTGQFRQLMGWTLILALAVMIWSEVFGQPTTNRMQLSLLKLLRCEGGRASLKENRCSLPTGEGGGRGRWYAAIFGLLGGFTTMIGNAAGPVMSVYLLSMRKEKRWSSESRVELCSDYAESRQSSPLGKMEYIGINAWFFLVVNLLKVPLQAFVWDNITWDSLILNLSMLPVIGIGALIGIRIVKLLPERVFRRFIQIVTIISVILMVI